MESIVLLVIALELALFLVLVFRGALRGPQGPPGPTGERGEHGERGAQGERGEIGHVHVTHGGAGGVERYEMLRGGLATGHIVAEGDADYQEALNTPGLSLRASDGSVIEGVQ